ncbi:MAG TPA: hypothetical protein H9761_19835 [Candidatus Eisenbergiella merdavium]|uniref:Uncharacterized protein n=1 Tax=Candidatus Eisenbergiella merdavium TaxID=2838551 RepID=A0A9D2NL26_9FIRM|nr:hypothetical protein [Candidatus Eisenbergiella merdavium]
MNKKALRWHEKCRRGAFPVFGAARSGQAVPSEVAVLRENTEFSQFKQKKETSFR